jgi:hypothetical protein
MWNTGNSESCRVDNISCNTVSTGTITPDADWQYIPDQSKGEWTPDVDWQYIEPFSNNGEWTEENWQFVDDNTRKYPCNEGEGSTLIAYDSEGNPVPANDGTLVGFDDADWELILTGGSPRATPDAWQIFLQLNGYGLNPNYQMNTAFYEFLGDLGYTGNLNDRQLQYWLDQLP